MKLCTHCERHILVAEPRCPFCGARFANAPSALTRCRQVVMIGLTVALGTTACGVVDPADTGASNVDSSGTAAAMTTTDGPAPATATTTDPMVSTGTDSTTAADSSSDDSDDQAGSFYAGCPDGGGASLECDLYQQDCPRGEKCMPWAEDGGDEWNATRCSPIADNPSDFDEPCMVEGSATSGIDNCVEGAMCFEVDAKTNEGTCQELCGGTEARPSCGDPADVCLAANDGLLPLCLPSCNPLMQDCGEGEGCFAADDEFLCIYTVAPDAAHGDPCGFINDCAPGQVCLDDALFSNCAGLACCSEVCSVADPNADAACATLDPVQACLPWYETPPAGLEDVGVCAQPLR